jgi:hypothetical protein
MGRVTEKTGEDLAGGESDIYGVSGPSTRLQAEWEWGMGRRSKQEPGSTGACTNPSLWQWGAMDGIKAREWHI